MPGPAASQFGGDVVALFVFLAERGNRLVAYFVNVLHQIAHAVSVHRETEFCLGRDLIPIGYRHVTHVVAEASKASSLPIGPRAGGPRPSVNALMYGRIGQVANHHFTI